MFYFASYQFALSVVILKGYFHLIPKLNAIHVCWETNLIHISIVSDNRYLKHKTMEDDDLSERDTYVSVVVDAFLGASDDFFMFVEGSEILYESCTMYVYVFLC